MLGFNLVEPSCTTCIGNSSPLQEDLSKIIHEDDLVATSVLFGNRNLKVASAQMYAQITSPHRPLLWRVRLRVLWTLTSQLIQSHRLRMAKTFT